MLPSRCTALLSILIIISLTGCVFSQKPQRVPSPLSQTQSTATLAAIPTQDPKSTTSTVMPPQPASTTVQTPAQSSLPLNAESTIDNIQLAWFYKPPATSMEELIDDYDFFILTHNDEAERDRLKSMGVNGPILQYLLMNEIMDPGSCNDSPHNDQVAFKPGDFCWIQNNYPNWFLAGQDGRILGNGQYRMMDSGNNGWINFWLERANLLQESYGWDGVFLDNVEASLSKIAEWGNLPANYPDDASYQAAIESELKLLYTEYFHPNGRPVFANIIAVRDPQVWLRYLQYLDGVMIENFATGWPGEDGLSPAEWEQQMQMAAQAQSMNKKIILVSQGDQYDKPRQEFALASYLMVSNGLAYFRYTNHNNYEDIWNNANQNLDLGVPLGDRYQNGQSWRRDFSKGYVIVNPIARTASITTD